MPKRKKIKEIKAKHKERVEQRLKEITSFTNNLDKYEQKDNERKINNFFRR